MTAHSDIGSVQRLVRHFECRWCGRRFEMTGQWRGRPQGPQCPCNPNSWGNWVIIDRFTSDDLTYIDGMIRPIDSNPGNPNEIRGQALTSPKTSA